MVWGAVRGFGTYQNKNEVGLARPWGDVRGFGTGRVPQAFRSVHFVRGVRRGVRCLRHRRVPQVPKQRGPLILGLVFVALAQCAALIIPVAVFFFLVLVKTSEHLRRSAHSGASITLLSLDVEMMPVCEVERLGFATCCHHGEKKKKRPLHHLFVFGGSDEGVGH